MSIPTARQNMDNILNDHLSLNYNSNWIGILIKPDKLGIFRVNILKNDS
jgi:hypothetical protein